MHYKKGAIRAKVRLIVSMNLIHQSLKIIKRTVMQIKKQQINMDNICYFSGIS